MPRGFTEREKELIGRRLLEQGDKHFSTYGLKRTSVEELAEAAGISKGSFYSFYESKEALFMEVAERAEQRFRDEVIAAIDRPGPGPRARFLHVLQTACSLFKSIPLLRSFTGSDFDLLLLTVPEERLQEHLAEDRRFFEALMARCREAGIPIRPPVEQIRGLLYALVLVILREDDAVLGGFGGTADILMALIAAFAVGEVEVGPEESARPRPAAVDEGSR